MGWDFETRAVHGGLHPERNAGATVTPIYATGAFEFADAEGIEDAFAGRSGAHIYSRISNPTVGSFEERLCELEQGLGAVATSSGMAAVLSAVLALAGAGDVVAVSRSLFSGTLALFDSLLARLGIRPAFFSVDDEQELDDVLAAQPRLVFVEAIGNPRLDVADVPALAARAHAAGVPVVLDATLTTPWIATGKSLGADIVVHSTTKYITGGGTAVGGVIVDTGQFGWGAATFEPIVEAARKYGGRFAFLATLRKTVLQNTGACASPFSAFLQSGGLETLALRMERHCANALALSLALDARGDGTVVNYPGLPGSPWHGTARKLYGEWYGGLLTIKVGSRDRAFEVINRLSLAKRLANLGDARTLVIHPASTMYRDCTGEQREHAGVSDDLIRISVGIESARDIVADFRNALDSA